MCRFGGGHFEMIWIDPQTRQRVLYCKHTGDLQYDVDGDSAIANETVPLIGPWEDYTGSDATVSSRAQQQFAGVSNLLEGQDPGVQGEKLPALNEVGQRSQTTRRRRIKRRIHREDLKKVRRESNKFRD